MDIDKANSNGHTDQARLTILDSAIKVFSQRGFDGGGLREIARRAGVSHAMIKYYFGSKEQLWRDAVSFLFERQRRELQPEAVFATGSDQRQRLRVFCEQLIRYWARHPEHGRLVMQASMTPGPCLDWLIHETKKNHELFLAYFGGEAAIEPQDNKLTTVAMLYLLVGACQTVFVLEHEARELYGVDVSEPAFIDRFVSLAVDRLIPAATADKAVSTSGADSGHEATEISPARVHFRRTSGGLELTISISNSEL